VYVGDSHQQIYEWRKAVNVLDSLGDFRRFPLTKSFRFNAAIAEEANRILTLLQADLRVVGNDAVSSVLAVCPSPDVILTRTNAEAIAQLMEAQVDGLRAGLVGGTARVEALALAAQQLKAGQRTDHPELMAFETWEQVQEHVEDADEARELQVLVKLVDKHGSDVLLEAVRAAVPEDQADLVLSTVHKVKGREWSRVKIAPDFPVPVTDSRETGKRELRAEEARLAYVAVTRTQNVLDSRELTWVGALADRLGQERIFEELPFGAMV
jgi:superfamily I DNA/RNA helicase